MERWEPNSNWKDLPRPEIGDIVHLMLVDAFLYTAKVIVTGIGDDDITGDIEALFDSTTGDCLQGGEKMHLVGKQVSFRSCFMQKVIKPNAQV